MSDTLDRDPSSTRWTVTFPVSTGDYPTHFELPSFGVKDQHSDHTFTLRRRYAANTPMVPSATSAPRSKAKSEEAGSPSQHALRVTFSEVEESPGNTSPAPLYLNEDRPFYPEGEEEEEDEGATGSAAIEAKSPLRPSDDDVDVRNLLDSERRRGRKGKQPERRDVLQRWPAERRSQIGSKSPNQGNTEGNRHGNGMIREPEPIPSTSESPVTKPNVKHVKRKIRKAKLDYTWHANAGSTVIAKPPSNLNVDDLGTLFLHRISADGRVTDAVQVWMWDQFDDGSTGWRSIDGSSLPHHPMSPELTLSFTPTGDPSWIGPVTAKRPRKLPQILP
ncbi:uncharacterized protein B0H18DRAFT_952524 [Fomitopsis serialis]|uniref:uncharacterized protein n=1 Tax=Fomitopsis serialis TaxID=139415 RepID=UPI0020077D03|nr:uncharacterized protein B0H18DRAFT_952524 [Neoantrodia serialis]KAH9931846.1 hypothetical protein B0H18DRAFT_952524 [Neoantrodia serialis]